MSFIDGFEKTASPLDTAMSFGKKALRSSTARGLVAGAKSSGAHAAAGAAAGALGGAMQKDESGQRGGLSGAIKGGLGGAAVGVAANSAFRGAKAAGNTAARLKRFQARGIGKPSSPQTSFAGL
jgi:hypothetical protein